MTKVLDRIRTVVLNRLRSEHEDKIEEELEQMAAPLIKELYENRKVLPEIH